MIDLLIKNQVQVEIVSGLLALCKQPIKLSYQSNKCFRAGSIDDSVWMESSDLLTVLEYACQKQLGIKTALDK